MKEIWFAFLQLFLQKKGKAIIVVSVIVLNLVAAILEGASFGFILLALSFLGNKNPTTSFPLISFFSSPLFTERLSQDLLFILSISLAVAIQIAKSGFSLLAQLLSTRINTELQTHLQKKIYTQIMGLSFSCVSRYKVGDLVEYAKTPTTAVHVILDNSNKSFVSLLNIFALFGMMFLLSPLLTGLIFLIFGALGMVQKLIVRLLAKYSYKISEYLTVFSMDIVQTLHGLRAIFTFDRQQQVLNKTGDLLNKIANITKRASLLGSFIPFINEVSGISLVGIFLILGYYLSDGNHPLPILLTFVTIAYRLNGKIQQLLSSVGAIANLWGQAGRIRDILNPQGKEFTSSEGKLFDRFKEKLSLWNVSLFYPDRKAPAIRELNCEISKGKVTAFVGLSGAGKSSVLDLLLRLYEPTEGSILVDGTPIQEYNLSSWRRTFGVVSQDIFIFNDTIEGNIRFGAEDLSEEQVLKYARLAGVDEFVSKLPDKYQTVVGERGYRLSGGERQRLSLARALVRDPQILVLDEATSNLDSKSEWIIKKALLELQKEKTLIIVAHRLSTIMHADQIIVMERGQIVERGAHEQLISEKGLYASLWEIQSQNVALEEVSG